MVHTSGERSTVAGQVGIQAFHNHLHTKEGQHMDTLRSARMYTKVISHHCTTFTEELLTTKGSILNADDARYS